MFIAFAPREARAGSVPAALSPLGERVDRPGVFFSRGRPGEGVLSPRLFPCSSELAGECVGQ